VYVHPEDDLSEIVKKASEVRPTERQLRWQRLELTAFIHFGMNTFTGREWGDGKTPPETFNPSNLDAKQWVTTLKNSGFKQVILTAKHHDGFCLWPSKYTEYSVKNSAWKQGRGDVVREVAEACHDLNVEFGIYLSPWDRNNPKYGEGAPYNTFFINQLTELLTQYGTIDEVWFDGANGEGPSGKKQEYDFENWYKTIRQLQPQAVIAVMGPDVRWVGTETGVGRETEWSVVPVDEQQIEKIAANAQQDVNFKPLGSSMKKDLGSRDAIKKAKALVWYPAETDVSIRPGWFYHEEEDDKVKTAKQLMDIYFTSVGRNSVLLLNVPPDKQGRIAASDIKTLMKWKKQRETLFSKNLLQGSRMESTGNGTLSDLLDRTDITAIKGKDTTLVLEFEFKKEVTFNVLKLQEDISKGQRVEQFILEVKQNGGWEKVAEGSTIGYKRLLRFSPLKAHQIRLRLYARNQPLLASMGLYEAVTH